MGLNSVYAAFLLASLIGCMAKSVATPNKRYYDCCSPSLQPIVKQACKVAEQYPNNTIIDDNGGLHIFIWSNCKPGEEPWRKWE